MNIDIETKDGIHIVHIQGDLVGEHSDLIEEVTNLLTGPGVGVVIDLRAVPFMNSTGLSELVRITAQANVQEDRIALAGPSPFVAGVLQTTQLNRFFDVYPTLDEALNNMK